MRSGSLLALLALAAAGCGSSKKASAFQVIPGDNVLAVSVSGPECGGSAYLNEPCVSVKVCAPGTTSCATIGGLLLDTGSYGLRVFKQALPATLASALPAVQPPGAAGPLAECVQYADLSADWGPVVSADVVLANEPAVTVPIQIIDSTYGTVPSTCPSPETAPAGFNGILGVGPFPEDCGASCPASANWYFTVSGGSATAATVDSAYQVQNPVAHLPIDDNGIIVVLPSVPGGGSPYVVGSLVLGIGTRTNNAPTSASPIALDAGGNFTTTLNGNPMDLSFVDTGSNGLFFSGPSITACTTPAAQGWYCPSQPVNFTATNGPSGGLPGYHLSTPFQVGNVEGLVASGNGAFSNAAGTGVKGGGFDWGLPFFLGRTVYLGMAGRTTKFGNGPIVAY
jgi:hypothetical protein